MLVFLVTLLTASTAKPDYDTLCWMAASEFYEKGTVWEEHKEFAKFHLRALPYFRNLSKQDLKNQLEPIVMKEGVRSRCGPAAAYVMALHGVDVARNCRRLWSAAAVPYGWDGNWDVADSAAQGLSDIYFRTGYMGALEDLLALKSDGAGAEIQDAVIASAFARAPEPFLQIARDGPGMRKALAIDLAMGDEENAEIGFKKLSKMPSLAKPARRLQAEFEKELAFVNGSQPTPSGAHKLPSGSKSKNSSSVRTSTPISCAFCSLEPAPGPATT